jgi:hypothetical protein
LTLMIALVQSRTRKAAREGRLDLAVQVYAPD